MKIVGISPTEKNSTLVQSLIGFIEEQSTDSKADFVQLAKGIFRKLPSYLAIESDLQVLLDIIQRSHHLIRTHVAEELAVSISHFPLQRSENNVGILICLKDRPFIVDTIFQFFKEKNIELLCLTHPIIEDTNAATGNTNHYSLSYIQVENTPHVHFEPLLLELKKRLSVLATATDHFDETLQILSDAITSVETGTDELKEEISSFLKWLKDDGFIFMGYYSIESQKEYRRGIASEDSLILFPSLDTALRENIQFINSDTRSLFCSKTTIKSIIHRSEYLDIISVKTQTGIVHNFIGIFSSKTKTQEATSTPILRKKLADVLIEEGLLPNTHDYKEMISLADTLPKSDFLQYSKEQVKQYFHEVTHAQVQGTIKLIHIIDRLERFHYFTVAMPRERYSQKSIRAIEDTLRNSFTNAIQNFETHAVLGDHQFVLVRIMIPCNPKTVLTRSLVELEEILLERTISWKEKFHINLSEEFEEAHANSLYSFYSNAFSKAYQGTHDPGQALQDVIILEQLSIEQQLEIVFFKLKSLDDPYLYKLRVFKRGEVLTLSNIVPYLSNCGFDVINEVVHAISTEGSVWANVYELDIRPQNTIVQISEEQAHSVLIPALKKILLKQASNDLLNTLLINPSIPLSRIEILRALVRYLSQIKVTSSPRHAIEALIFNPDIASLLVEYFEQKFNPRDSRDAIASHDRFTTLSQLDARIQKSLKKVTNISHDRILFSMHQVIDAMLRTNFFVREDNAYLSFKIAPEKISAMPFPKPYREIFVSAPDFQGVHLRGGKIARGGLRWSSRPDDFRTEVLGLMKTQMVKNAIIVPVGAKGGFILHEEPTQRKELLEKVEQTYKKFIRALLDITDNRIGEEIKSPPHCICYDELDPYFVVAADRGTATFSDIANKIAVEEYHFWLGDAFASGGSVGYDHKKLGITAKGAWECTKRHFNELGIDIKTQEFTVAGIGDMSGDVFGNGLILSDNAKLIAAFDHRHIFIDPAPNSKISFKERVRLFNLPSSSWEDYDKSILSTGGMIVSRSEKEVTLSEEAQVALATDKKHFTTNELIQTILKAPVDLLWNGGIGTYIKSSEEDHLKAADKSNDDVRIDAIDLRAKIIAEGGNLGLTQGARIEYSKIGGKINTDAVDNSGGVDMSDLEVNLKLLFREAIASGKISTEERNRALKEIESQACEKIVDRNKAQSIALSLGVKRSRKNLNYYKDLIDYFEKEKRVHRVLDTLPSTDTIEKRKQSKAGLSRPELAVLVAHAKMWAYEELLSYSLIDDAALIPALSRYFPGTISTTYENLLHTHPLRREIIATQVANTYVERMGAPFTLIAMNQTGARPVDIFKSYLISASILDCTQIVQELRALDTAVSSKVHISALLEMQSMLEYMTYWFIEDNSKNLGISETVALFKSEFLKLLNSIDSILSSTEKNAYEDSLKELLGHGIPIHISKILSAGSYAPFFLDVIRASQKNGRNAIAIAKLHSQLISELELSKILQFTSTFNSENSWELSAINTLHTNLRFTLSHLCDAIVSEQNSTDIDAIHTYFEKRKDLVKQLTDTLSQLRHDEISLASAYIVLNIVSALTR